MKILTRMRDDPKVMGLSDKGFRAYVNALCWCGEHETDGEVAPNLIPEKALRELNEAGLVDGLNIRHWTKHQRTRAELETLRAERRAIGRKGGLAKARAVATPASVPEVEVEVERELEEPTSTPTSTFHDDACSLVALLVASLREREVKVPSELRTWEQTAERLLRIDARPLDEARDVLRFSQSDPFWSVNILSMPKFRAQYDALRLRMNAPTNGRQETTAERLLRLGIS